MSDWLRPFAEWSALFTELLGILVILGFTVYTLGFGAYRLFQGNETEKLFREIRHRLGRGILLGLEFLVAADIIHTVAVELSFKSVGVLAAILVIRTFLSFSLEVELNGRWPWQESDLKDK
ncbi:DUF1622 domain-containing protein [Proteobacteria bacterium 005FR1]|nr:DUF1622 domain-containing protein [Proteobacteria bacterium 005FR1]